MRTKHRIAFDLRIRIKKILSIIQEDFEEYSSWAKDIETIIEAVFVDFLDAPTDQNLQTIINYWNSTEPVLTAIMHSGFK